jgi:hypothetical protein
MIGRRTGKHWILGGALLLLLGCKPTPPAAEPFVPKELLSAGEPPRAPLRYAVADGTTTTSILSWKVAPRETGASTVSISGLEMLEIKAVAGPAQVDEKEIGYDFEIVDSMAVAGAGAKKKLLEDIEESGAFLKGMGYFVAIDDLGNIRSSRSDQKTAEVPLRLLWMIYNTIDFAYAPYLPEEAVGIGGRWLIRNQLKLYGTKMVQEATYTLIERTDDEIVLDVTFERVGRRQVVDFPDDDALLEVESARLNATGRIRVDLKALGSSANVTGRVNNVVVFVEDGVRENRTIDESFELQISSKTTLPEAGGKTQ